MAKHKDVWAVEKVFYYLHRLCSYMHSTAPTVRTLQQWYRPPRELRQSHEVLNIGISSYREFSPDKVPCINLSHNLDHGFG
jgi:hypothetical protein